MIEQMVETRSWKAVTDLIENERYQLCGDYRETVEHTAAGCRKTANSGYLTRYNRTLMVKDIE